jgi:heme/copper-type cytochrome/quinol oxidase subunit 3
VAVRTQAYDSAAAAEVALDTRLVGLGTWLFIAADVFFFTAWYFAFFYLRAINNNQSWLQEGVGTPSRGYGTIVIVLAIGMAFSYAIGSRQPTRSLGFRIFTPMALVYAIATCLFQGYEMWHLGFGLTQGGYPSLFAGLSGSWVIQVLLATGWLASIVLQTGPAGDTVVRRQPAASFAWILLFLAAIGVVNYILLYFVA